MFILRLFLYFVIFACLTGCGVAIGTLVDTAVDIATYPVKEYVFMGSYKYDNTWPSPYQPPLEKEKNHGEILLGVAVSGGGSRSAYFMACVMEQLSKIPIEPGSSRTYADEIDFISSVSGGSLSSAYFCLNHKNFQPLQQRDQFFEDYKYSMRINFQNSALVSYTLGGLCVLDFFSYYDRGDLMANVWDQIFFDDVTFKDLKEAEDNGAPTLLINGTILNDGLKFVFSNLPDKRFNESEYFKTIRHAGFIKYSATHKYRPFYTVGFESIDSDISQYRVSKAVVASASVPNLLGPVTLKDNRSKHKKRLIHIVDGGVYDNYGIETLMQIFTAYLDKNPSKKAKIIIIDGSGYFQEDNRSTDEFTVADYSMRPLEIAWLRTKGYMEYVYQTAVTWTNKDGKQPYQNLTFDLISLYGFWSSSEKSYGILPSQKELSERSLEQKMIDTVLRPDIATKEFFDKIVQIPTSFQVRPNDATHIEKVAKEVVEKFAEKILANPN